MTKENCANADKLNKLERHTVIAEDGVKPVLLAVSFGTSYKETREATIDAIEAALAEAYPEYQVRRAFTSQMVINILEKRDGYKVDNVTEAVERLIGDGVKEVLVQPTHVIPGFEYNDMLEKLSAYRDKFTSLQVGRALLTSDEDYDTLVSVLKKETGKYNGEDTSLVFMGHGSRHEANEVYIEIERRLHAAGLTNYFIGTAEGTPLIDEVLAKVKAGNYKKIVLLPLMIVAGDHASNDMAGDEEGSWKDIFTKAGYEVECVLTGLGEYQGIRQMFITHAGEVMN